MGRCGSLFVNLGGGGGGSIADGVLQTPAALSSSLQVVKDNLGNSSALSISTTKIEVAQGSNTGSPIIRTSNGAGFTGDFGQLRLYAPDNGLMVFTSTQLSFGGSGAYAVMSYVVNTSLTIGSQLTLNSSGAYFGTGTITQNGALTIKGSGSVIISLRDSSNVEKGYLDSGGAMIVSDGFGTNRFKLGRGSQDGSMTLTEAGGGSTNVRIQLGGASASHPAIIKNLTDLHVKLADNTGFTGFACGFGSSTTISVTTVSGAMGLGFFNTPAINQPTTGISEATFKEVDGGSNVKTTDTYDGYTLGQIVKAIRNLGLIQ